MLTLLLALVAHAQEPCDQVQLLLSEVVVTPDGAELVEIHNPTDRPIALDHVYLTDATFAKGGEFYWHIVDGGPVGGGGFGDFNARFPASATIGPGAYQTIALSGSRDYEAVYEGLPTYELYEDDSAADAVPDLREAVAGSINAQGSLDDRGEVLILYCWDGESDLVRDLDYLLWGSTRREAVDKTDVAVDGPDRDGTKSTYRPDTSVFRQPVVSVQGHAEGSSWQRVDFTEGKEAREGGNGVGGHDETSEDLMSTWQELAPTPGAPRPGVDATELELAVAPEEGVTVGGIVTFTVRVRNTASVPLTAVEVGLELPEPLVFQQWITSPGGSWAADDGGAFAWTGDLAPGTETMWVLLARVDEAGPTPSEDEPLVAEAFVSGGDDRLTTTTELLVSRGRRVDLDDPLGLDDDDDDDFTPAPKKLSFENRGQLSVYGRGFLPDDEPLTEDYGAGLQGRLQLDAKHGSFRERARVWGLLDPYDQERSTFVVEEATVEWRSSLLRLQAGVLTQNLSALEAFHPADMINARVLDTKLEDAQKIGEPMATARIRILSGALYGYFMPAYIAPKYPSAVSRVNFADPGQSLGDALWLERDGELADDIIGAQWAVSLDQNLGPAEINLHALQHMDRAQPVFVFDREQGTGAPMFLPVTQLGGTYNHVLGTVIAKAEVAWRQFELPEGGRTPFGVVQDRDHVAAAAGLEYGTSVGRRSLSLLAEAQGYFLESGDDPDLRAELGLFQRDVLVGGRFAFNDLDSRTILLAGIFDLERPEQLLIAKYGQRMGDVWTLDLQIMAPFAPEPDDGDPVLSIGSIYDARYGTIEITRHF